MKIQEMTRAELIAGLEKSKKGATDRRRPGVDRVWHEYEARRFARELVRRDMEGICDNA